MRYWIGNFSSDQEDERAVASSFLALSEFKERHRDNPSDSTYVNPLYKNVLNRDADTSGLNYLVIATQYRSGNKVRGSFGFSESTEQKGLFSEMTGIV
mgnify:CR=1 FL=1